MSRVGGGGVGLSEACPYSAASAFFIMASDASGPLNPMRYSSRMGAKHS